MDRLRTKAADCKYKEYDRLLTEQFINRLNDDGMVDEILKEANILQDIEDASCEYVLLWAFRLDMPRAQNPAINEIKQVNLWHC